MMSMDRHTACQNCQCSVCLKNRVFGDPDWICEPCVGCTGEPNKIEINCDLGYSPWWKEKRV